MFWSGKSFCRCRLTPWTWGQLHNPERDFREGCGWESKRKDPRTAANFSQRNCFVIALQLHSVFNYKLCFRPRLKRVPQQFVWQNKLQIPHDTLFESPLKALFGQQQDSFQTLLGFQLLFLKVQLCKQVTVGTSMYITSCLPQQDPIHSLW